MSELEYEPLRPNEFRLVSFPLETNNDKEIDVHLKHAFLDESVGSYDVLSYRWGPSGEESRILCNGKALQIPSNLMDALRALRDRVPKLLWIDSICINQRDIQEKSRQIQLMSTINQKSRRTILWMGAAAVHTSAAFALISMMLHARKDALKDYKSAETLAAIPMSAISNYRRLLPSPASETWRHLDEIFDSPLNPFKSAWILEDIGFYNDLILQCGAFEVSWENICNAFDAYVNFGFPNMLRNAAMHTMIELRNLERENFGNEGLRLSQVLEVVRPLQSYDPRDRVMVAYIGKNSPHLRLRYTLALPPVDYSQSVAEVYTETARIINTEDQHEPFLSLSMIEEQSHSGYDLPSWVPDWTKPVQTKRLGSLKREYCASTGEDQPLFETAGRDLHLSGYIIDSIAHVSALLPNRRLYDMFNISGINNAIFTEWHEWAEAKMDKKCLVYTQSNSDMLLLHWAETITAQGCKVHDGPLASANLRRRNLLMVCRAWLDYLETEDQEETVEIRQFYLDCLPSHGRRLGISQRGHFCLLPKRAKSSDLVFIPRGSNVPFIVRQSPNAGNNSWLIVGECYLHGAMLGEALKWENISGLEFTLS